MGINSREDRVFFTITGLIGLLVDVRINGIESSIFSEALVRACLIAFISGFIGIVGKKVGERLLKNIFNNEKDTKNHN